MMSSITNMNPDEINFQLRKQLIDMEAELSEKNAENAALLAAECEALEARRKCKEELAEARASEDINAHLLEESEKEIDKLRAELAEKDKEIGKLKYRLRELIKSCEKIKESRETNKACADALLARLDGANKERDFYRKWALELKSLITTHDVYKEFLPALDRFEEESKKCNIVIGKESEG